MNEVLKTIASRYSCRDFSDKKVSEEDIEKIVNAALAAPSGNNRQNWRVIVLKNKELILDLEKEGLNNLKKIPDQSIYDRIQKRGGKLFYNAPMMIVIPIKPAVPLGAEMFDAGIITQNIAIAAESLNINSLICGLIAFSFAGERCDEFKKRLNFPESFEIGIAVLLGYEKTRGKPHDLDLSKVIYI